MFFKLLFITLGPRIEFLFSKIDEFVKMTYVDDIALNRQYAALFDATFYPGVVNSGWQRHIRTICKISTGTFYGL